MSWAMDGEQMAREGGGPIRGSGRRRGRRPRAPAPPVRFVAVRRRNGRYALAVVEPGRPLQRFERYRMDPGYDTVAELREDMLRRGFELRSVLSLVRRDRRAPVVIAECHRTSAKGAA